MYHAGRHNTKKIMPVDRGVGFQTIHATSRALFNESPFEFAIHAKSGRWHVLRMDYFWYRHNPESLSHKVIC